MHIYVQYRLLFLCTFNLFSFSVSYSGFERSFLFFHFSLWIFIFLNFLNWANRRFIFKQFIFVIRGEDKLHKYIRCEMTPTSVGGEQQISISGGSQSPIWYSLRQDCRDAQKKYVMHCMTRISQQECRGILEYRSGYLAAGGGRACCLGSFVINS